MHSLLWDMHCCGVHISLNQTTFGFSNYYQVPRVIVPIHTHPSGVFRVLLFCILASTWYDQSFSFYLHDGCAEASAMCWSWLLWLMRVSLRIPLPTPAISDVTLIVESAIVVVFTPKGFNFWKLRC